MDEIQGLYRILSSMVIARIAPGRTMVSVACVLLHIIGLDYGQYDAVIARTES